MGMQHYDVGQGIKLGNGTAQRRKRQGAREKTILYTPYIYV
uniref:Alternative protein CTLA4 n=1 Tax=Homo sapiens TaxID=9606 RepID=L8E9B1_HUMAN|nr:alternative protein CTLA4 [Homo sapiens]